MAVKAWDAKILYGDTSRFIRKTWKVFNELPQSRRDRNVGENRQLSLSKSRGHHAAFFILFFIIHVLFTIPKTVCLNQMFRPALYVLFGHFVVIPQPHTVENYLCCLLTCDREKTLKPHAYI